MTAPAQHRQREWSVRQQRTSLTRSDAESLCAAARGLGAAVLEASRTCEVYGKPGRRREAGGTVACDVHEQVLGVS